MGKDSEIRVCKKCHKELPEGYKYKTCEACRNKQIQAIKDGFIRLGKGAVFAVGILGTAAGAFVLKDKMTNEKEEKEEEKEEEEEE